MLRQTLDVMGDVSHIIIICLTLQPTGSYLNYITQLNMECIYVVVHLTWPALVDGGGVHIEISRLCIIVVSIDN